MIHLSRRHTRKATVSNSYSTKKTGQTTISTAKLGKSSTYSSMTLAASLATAKTTLCTRSNSITAKYPTYTSADTTSKKHRHKTFKPLPPFYIVEGSNENGIIKSQTTSVRPPENFDWDEANASTNKPDYNDFFIQFPTGEGGNTRQGGSDPGQIRNPLNVCRTINNLCN